MLPPDINDSQLRFTVEPGRGVRFGLTAIKNVGEGAIESLLAVREKQGRIRSLHTLCEELDLRLVNKRVIESLVKAGALDSLGFVELLVHLEREFAVKISIEDLELDNFRSVARIAELVGKLQVDGFSPGGAARS